MSAKGKQGKSPEDIFLAGVIVEIKAMTKRRGDALIAEDYDLADEIERAEFPLRSLVVAFKKSTGRWD